MAKNPQKVRTALLGAVTLGLLLNFVIHPAIASLPADKVVASGSKIVAAAPGTNVTLLSATMRSSAPTDAILNVSLECSILTALVTDNDHNSATASGTIRVWVQVDGVTVPINDVSAPGDHTPGVGNDSDSVTFCNREYSRTVVDQENPQDGVDQISDYIKTKSSHSFQWLVLNLGAGVHSIAVKADLSTSQTDSATAEAYVGNRTLIVEPAKLANDATV
jgi:hypothetical protein